MRHTATTESEPVGPRAAVLALLLAALWGGTPVAISFSVDQLPPVAVAAIRFALAAGFMLFWCRWEGSELRLRAGQARLAAVVGLLLFVQIALFNLGIAWSNSSHATVLINTFVLWVVAIEHFVTREARLTAAKTAGLFCAAAGGLIVLWTAGDPVPEPSGRDEPTLAGDLVLLASGMILGVKVAFTKHALQRIEPGKLIFWHDLVGVALFAAWSAAFEQPVWRGIAWPTWLGLLYQGVIVAGFCFALQAVLLRRHAASQVSIYSVATPLFGIALAAAFRGDPLSPWLLAAGASVAAGILLVNRSAAADGPRPEN